MRTVPQIARKYVKLVRIRPGPPEAVDHLVYLQVEGQRFRVSPEPLDKRTAEWLRTQLAHALYKFGVLEGAICNPKKNSKR